MRSLSKKQKEGALLFLSIVLFLALSAYSYFTLYSPLKEAKEQLQLETANERDVLYALRMQAAGQSQSDIGNSYSLQQQVPVIPLEDAVLLQIQKAEVKSDSSVVDINFTLGEFVIPNPPENVSNVKQLLTEVSLEADSYASIERFIDEIEKMDRIFIVDSIELESPEEVQQAEAEKARVRMTISFSAFYRPDLVNLKGDAPKVDAPPAARKQDPTPFNESPVEGEVE